jgi:Tol biopolymer transport system component
MWLAFSRSVPVEDPTDFGPRTNRDIFVIHLVSGEVTNLTNTPDIREERPIWSPDGHQLAFSGKKYGDAMQGVYVMDRDGRNRRQLTQNPEPYYLDTLDGSIAWSPDGNYLAFDRSTATSAQDGLYIVSVATGHETQLLPSGSDPAWQPVAP